MNIRNCYACGGSIPELRFNDGKYSFHCDKCTCATKWKEDLFDAQSDWNEGIIYPEDDKKFFNLMRKYV